MTLVDPGCVCRPTGLPHSSDVTGRDEHSAATNLLNLTYVVRDLTLRGAYNVERGGLVRHKMGALAGARIELI